MSDEHSELNIKNESLDRENDRLRLQVGKFRMHIAGSSEAPDAQA